jgi:hypothetical protein
LLKNQFTDRDPGPSYNLPKLPLAPLLLLHPLLFISDYSFLVGHTVDRDDQHLLAHAMASDFTVFSNRTIERKREHSTYVY